MKYSDFKIVWKDIILKYYDELENFENEHFSGKALKLKKYSYFRVYFSYERNRKIIRKLYMSEEKKPMDRHKIASNLMCSILKSNIIRVRKIRYKNLPLPLLLSNEYLSFYVAINIVELYKRDKGYKEYSILFPETYIEAEDQETSYIENFCKALHYIGKIDVGIIFSYANSLFLLEKYTDTELSLL